MKSVALGTAMAMLMAGCGCQYEDPFGNCISKEEHDRRVAHDAAVNALTDLTNWCSGHPQDDQCKVFRKP